MSVLLLLLRDSTSCARARAKPLFFVDVCDVLVVDDCVAACMSTGQRPTV